MKVLVVQTLTECLEIASAESGVTPNVVVVGQVATSLPSDSRASVNWAGSHRPGRSVGHHTFLAGSLGLYVSFFDSRLERELVGFIGAAHVLGWNNALPGDHILSPAPPDADRNASNYYGALHDYRRLVHYSNETDPNIVLNEIDAALVALADSSVGFANLVPAPTGNAFLRVENVMSHDDIRAHLGEPVYLAGRTSTCAAGRLKVTDLAEYPVRMPDKRNYMFRGLAVVESAAQTTPFSQAGDSGGLVYAVDGSRARAVGFVVGGSDTHTFIVPAQSNLHGMKAVLHG